MATALIVPVDVRALTVSLSDQNLPLGHVPMADFGHLRALGPLVPPYIGPTVTAAALPLAGESPLPAGVHLHWALPDALTQGRETPSGIVFPTVPNRWLITRILQDTSQQSPCQMASWVVESDRLSDLTDPNLPLGFQQPTAPSSPSAPQSYQYIGARFPLTGWSETSSPRLAPLTAVGYGEQTFASYYPNCSSVFGFVDDFSDQPTWNPETSVLTYQVIGWYATPTDDPLNEATTNPVDLASFWTYNGSSSSTLLSGFVENITYDPGGSYLANQSPSPMTAVIAPSQGEAVSALLAQHVSLPNAEQALNALQYGLLTPQGGVDATAQFEEDVHAAGFGSQPGGTTWAVVEPDGGAKGQASSNQSEATLPVAVAALLNALNTAQAALDSANRQLASKQWQLYQDWFKLQVVLYSLQPPASFPGNLLPAHLHAEVDAIQATQASIAGPLQDTLDAAQAAVEQELPSGYMLVTSTADQPYFTPHDPVLLLAGPDVAPPERYGNDGAGYPDGLLPCRLSTEIVSSLTLDAGLVANSTLVTVSSAALPPVGPLTALPEGLPWQELMQEPVLLSAKLIDTLVACVASGGGGPGNPYTLDPAQTQSSILAAQASLLAAGDPVPKVELPGTAPASLGIVDGSTLPWLPLRVEYEVSYVPVQPLDVTQPSDGYTPDLVNASFALAEGEVDFSYAGSPPDAMNVQVLAGTTLLTNLAANDMAAVISAYIANDPAASADSSLQAILKSVTGCPQLAQSLGGMTAAMLMLQQDLQLPIADPGGAVSPSKLTTAVASAAGVQAMYNPLPEAGFSPVRAGQLSLKTLRLVDVFGRYLDYPAPTTVVARSMQPPSDWPVGSTYLAPRIAQPARLLCNWVSAENQEIETNAHPATSPIIGFVVPSFLDRSFLVYSSAGAPVVTVQLTSGNDVSVTAAPGSGFAPDAGIDTIFTGQNADLQAFVQSLQANGALSLSNLFDAVQTTLETSLPAGFQQSTTLATLCGQPLALARLSLTLDLAGPPALDASWYRLAQQLEGDSPPCLWSDVQFPVLLGDQAQLNDTLVGFFLESGGATDYSTLYTPYAQGSVPGVAPQQQTTLTLKPQQTVTAVLLLDPRGCLHAASGILPMLTLEIPPDQSSAALRALAVSFIARPLLSGGTTGAPSLTLPSAASGSRWSWATLDAGQWSLQTIQVPATAVATLDYSPQTVLNGWLVLAEPAVPAAANGGRPTESSTP